MDNGLVSGFNERVSEMLVHLPSVPAPEPAHVGILLVGAGLALAGAYLEKKWWPDYRQKREAKKRELAELQRKARRTKEAMDIREVRLQELMCEMIVDGLLKLDIDGKISPQEHRKFLKEFGTKMGFNDLLSTKGRVQEIKDAIIRRIASDMHNKNTVTVDKCGRRLVNTKIPGPKPGEQVA